MPDRVDYYINENWDIEFTEWGDFRTATGTDSLIQNFVITAAENTNDIVGEQMTATKLSRHTRRLESSFKSKESVSYFAVNDVTVEENKITYNLIVGSDELQATLYV